MVDVQWTQPAGDPVDSDPMHTGITRRATLASVGTDGLTPGGLSTHSEALTVFTGLAFSSNFVIYCLDVL